MGKMSAKRRPGTDLNHDNWDEEQEQEEVGEFRKASADELKQRTFKVAKRRVRTAGGGPEDDATDGAAPAAATSSVFSGFGGFGKLGDATKPASSTFSFLSAGNSAAAATTTAATASTVSPFASLSSLSSSDKSSNGTSTNNTTTTTSSTGGDARNAAYYAKLKGLNQSVSAWIAKHIAENPVCLLTPIFDDYAAHLKELEQSNKTTEPVKTPDYTFKAAATSKASDTTPTAAPAVADTTSPFKSSFGASSFGGSAATPASTFSFGLSAAKPATTSSSSAETTTKAPAPTFSFGSAAASSTTSSSVAASKPTFSFGSAASTTSTAETTAKPPAATFSFGSSAASSSAAASGGASGFSFGGAASGSKPFTFANIKTPADHAREAAAAGTSGGDAGADEENEEPPKNEFTPVVEDDSLHSVRCKVFVKAGAEYVDRGVGQLFIKSAAEGTKTQLLVRADTNLGNVVLNILLTDGVPANRMGKNNVVIICVPTPDAKPEPVTVLVRVKNGEEADELLAQINKHKK